LPVYWIEQLFRVAYLIKNKLSWAYLAAENVRYVPQTYYESRYPAMVDENIRLTWYLIEHGQLPRLNQVTR
jgi:hypothetical protein